jgi:hypothetical protein
VRGLARIDGLADEVGHGDPPLRERVEEGRRQLAERVAAAALRLRGERAHVRTDDPQLLPPQLGHGDVPGHAARRAEQHDGAAGPRGGDRGRQGVRIAGRLDHDGGVGLDGVVGGQEARRSRGEGSVAPAAARRHDGDRAGLLERRQPLRERADRPRADHRHRVARSDRGPPHAVPGDDREVDERRVLDAHAVRHRHRPVRRHGLHGRVPRARHRDEVPRRKPLDPGADGQHASRPE